MGCRGRFHLCDDIIELDKVVVDILIEVFAVDRHNIAGNAFVGRDRGHGNLRDEKFEKFSGRRTLIRRNRDVHLSGSIRHQHFQFSRGRAFDRCDMFSEPDDVVLCYRIKILPGKSDKVVRISFGRR